MPDYQFQYLEEFVDGKSLEAKFARSIDRLAPLIHEVILPDVTAEGFKIYNYNTDLIVEKRKRYFEWDSLLLGIFECIVERFRKID